MRDWYTQQEAADLLGVSKATIYHYAKQKKIIKINDPHRLFREVRYQKAEIDRMAEDRSQQPTGKSPAAVAKELNLPLQRVYKYIQEGVIQAAEVPYGDEKIHYVISEEELQKLANALAPSKLERVRRQEYFQSSYDIALFQLFSSHNHLTARIMKNDQDDWGFYIPNYQKWVPYDEGIMKYNLKPAYSIHQKRVVPRGYVFISIPKNEVILYTFIDYLYATWGIENVGIREETDVIFISAKANVKPYPKHEFTVEQLTPFVQEGTIQTENDQLILVSAYRQTTVDFPIILLNRISELAETENITMSDWIERACKAYLQSEEIH